MSSFFTLPASQKKRKRSQHESEARDLRKRPSTSKASRDESISGSDISDDDQPLRAAELPVSDDDDEDFEDEDPAAKRIRLAEQYLANTEKAVLEDGGFDAAEVDAENLRLRMGERLKEDTAESKGKLYRWIADEFDWVKAEAVSFRVHQKAVTGVAISGEYAFTVGRDTMLAKWRLPRPTELKPGQAQSKKPQKVLVSEYTRRKNGTQQETHTGPILCVAASQDGRFVATGSADKKLIVWDAATLKPLKVFQQHRDAVTSLAFRRGTNQLFSTSRDRTVKIWSLDELTYVETLFGHQDEVVDVSSLAQEKCVSVGARDRTARYWKVVEESQLLFRGGGAPGKSKYADRVERNSGVDVDEIAYHEGSMDRVACIDEETFVTGSDNGALSLWNITKKKAVFTYPLAHGLDPPVPLEEASAEQAPDEAARPKPQPRWITALRAVPFSDTFVTGSWDGYVRAWKITSDKRRIEPLGRLGSVEGSVEHILGQQGLITDSLSNGALQAIKNGQEKHNCIEGFVNDLAIIDKGERAKDGLIIIAAVGKSPRLGRWKEITHGKNCAVYFEVPRMGGLGSDASNTTDTLGHSQVGGDDDFAGFE